MAFLLKEGVQEPVFASQKRRRWSLDSSIDRCAVDSQVLSGELERGLALLVAEIGSLGG